MIANPTTDPLAELQDVDSRAQRHYWSGYDWSRAGEEWSGPWGGTRGLWYGVLLPRLAAWLPAARVLEIGCGYGRVSAFLRPWCQSLTLVDLVPRCVDAARERFAGDDAVGVHLNDGVSLPMLAADSVDFAFSWDTLVTVERSTVTAYMRELRRVLRPGGVAVLHHSNLGEHAGEITQTFGTPGGRRLSQSADAVREDCNDAGLRCYSQELLLSKPHWLDCISVLVRDEGPGVRSRPRVRRNAQWGEEAERAKMLAEVYPPVPGTM